MVQNIFSCDSKNFLPLTMMYYHLLVSEDISRDLLQPLSNRWSINNVTTTCEIASDDETTHSKTCEKFSLEIPPGITILACVDSPLSRLHM